tara:strand:- start:572 stop:889 length:318 start_codon:yes stop_codon:yes gene_type:complete
MPTTSFQPLTPFATQRQISDVVNNTLRGKLNCTNEVTLTNSSTSTVVSDFNVGPDSVILFMPTNAAAATEMAAGGLYVSARSKNSFTVTHSSTTSTREFSYAVIG